MQVPQLDPKAGLQAFEEDVPKVLKILGASSIEELGWKRDNLFLMIPMTAELNGQSDKFLLRLGFHGYREWPPSAKFVNPETGDYQYPDDQHHVPQLDSPACRTHLAYQKSDGGKIQLICCSATLEFYQVLHSVDEAYVWKSSYTFYTTLRAIQRAMHTHYRGRFPAHGK